MELITTAALITLITTVAAAGVAVLPWTTDEIESTSDALSAVGEALGGAAPQTVRAVR